MKAVFFDIDGTLVSFRTHAVPQSTVRALARLRAAGVRCFIASGRHLCNIDNLGDLSFDGFVTVNGGMTYLDGKLIDSNPIANTDIESMLQMVYDEGRFPSCFVLSGGLCLSHKTAATDAIFEQLHFDPQPPICDLHRVADEPIYQMITFFGEAEEADVMCRLPHCESARWSPIFTDVVPRGQSKVRGMQAICDCLGIDQQDVVAFGDGGNDVEMLRFAGTGVAMGNAESKVCDIADVVCPSVDDDGIDWAVRHIFNL